MSSRAKSVGRASLAALLTLWPDRGPGPRREGRGQTGLGGPQTRWEAWRARPSQQRIASTSPQTSGRRAERAAWAPDSVLAAGTTAAMVSALLGAQAQNLAVGARPLPPGIQKNLAREKPLPPGIAKQAIPQPVLDTRLASGSTVSDNVSAERRLSDLLSIRRREW